MTPEELDDAEESGNGPSEMVGCGVLVLVAAVVDGIAWAALHGVPWRAPVP